MEFRKKTAILLSLLLAFQTMMPVQLAAAMPGPHYVEEEEEDGLFWGDTVDLLNMEKGTGSNFIDFNKWQEWQENFQQDEETEGAIEEEEEIDIVEEEDENEDQDEEEDGGENYRESTPSKAASSSVKPKKKSSGKEGKISTSSNATSSAASKNHGADSSAEARKDEKASVSSAAFSNKKTADKNQIASPSQAYDTLEIRTKTIDDEVVKVENKTAALAFNLKLDNDYLWSHADQFYTDVEDGKVAGLTGDDLEDLDKVDQWVKNYGNTEQGIKYFQPISFQCTIEGSLFDLDACVKENMPLETMSHENIGTYSLIKSGSNLVLKCEISSKVYNRTDVSAYQFVDLILKDEKLDGTYPLITAGEGGADIRIKFVRNLNDPDDLKGSYKLEKKGPAEINSPEVPYSILVSAETDISPEADLTGKYIVDQLPQELKMVEGPSSVTAEVTYAQKETKKYVLDTESTAEPTDEWQGTDKRNKLVFRIPEYNGNKATKAVISVKTEFTSDFYTKYINENKTVWSIINEAVLAQGDSPDKLTEIQTGSVEGTTGMPFFTKDGAPDGDLNGEKWKWTIGLNPYFTTAKGIYLIDCIPDTEVHNYTGNNSDELDLLWTKKTVDEHGTVTETGTRPMKMNLKTSDELDAITASGALGNLEYDNNYLPYSYENLKEDMVRGSKIAQVFMDGVAQGEGIYYTYQADGKTRAVFIAPIPSDCLKCPVSASYLTKSMVNRDVSSDASDQKKTMENEAAVVWETVTGPGPGTIDINRITMEKGVTANYSVLDKEALDGYDQKDQILTWEFYVNRFGGNLGEFVITDQFDTLKCELLPDSKNPEIFKVDRSTGEETPLADITEDKTEACFYEITKAGDSKTLKVTFKNIQVNDCYRFLIPVKVKDPELLTKQGKALGPVNNEAVYQFPGGNQGVVTKTVKANPAEVPNTWIEKEKVPFGNPGNEYDYDYENHLVKWKIRINPNHLSIGNAVVTDTLPVAMVNGVSTAVTQNPRWESVTRYTDKDNSSGISGTMAADKNSAEFGDVKITLGQNSPKNQIAFTFMDQSDNKEKLMNDCYEFVFTTEIKEEYRKSGLISDITSKFVLENNAVLDGYYQNTLDYQADAWHKVHAEAKAVNEPGVRVMDKNGKYHGYGQGNSYVLDGVPTDVSWIDWEIAVNRDGADLYGKTLEDKLGDWCELDTGSLKVYKINVNSDGSYSAYGNPLGEDVLGNGFSYDSSGFTFQIPEALRNQPLLFQFSAVLVDSVKASDMKNEAYFKDQGGANMSKENAAADGAKNFNFDDFAEASTAPLIRINKGSTNSELSGDRYKYPLPGAVFELAEMSAAGNVWKVKEGAKVKKKTSNASGMCNFIPLRRDVLYQVKETAAPAGYVVSGSYYYFIIDGRDGEEKGGTFTDGSAKILKDDGKEIGYTVDQEGTPGNLYRNSNFGKTGNDHYIMKRISNSPDESNQVKLTFKKQTDDGQPLKGVEFELVDRSEKLKTRSISSGENGIVTISNLDAGSYFLNEKNALTGFQPITNTASNIMAAVTVDATDLSNPKITPTGTMVKKDFSGGILWEDNGKGNQCFTVLNSPYRSKITLEKLSPSGGALSGAEFVLYGAYENGSLSEPAAALRQQAGSAPTSEYMLTNELSKACGDAGITALAIKHFTDPSGTDRTMAYLNDSGLLDGTYYLVEIKAPDHFIKDENIYELKVSKGVITEVKGLKTGETGTLLPCLVSTSSPSSKLKAVNQARSGIIGKKEVIWKDYEKQQKETPLGSILFNLYTADGTTLVREGSEATGEGVSQADGFFGFYDIPFGTYMVKEKGSGPQSDLYTISGDFWIVEVKDNQLVSQGKKNGASVLSPVLFQNIHKKGSLQINKVDGADQRPLEHVTFGIFPKDNPEQKICTLVYDSSGFYKLPAPDALTDSKVNKWKEPYLTWQEEAGVFSPSLIAGDYEVVEEKPEPGYQNDSNEQGELRRHLVTIEDKSLVTVTNDGTSDDRTAKFINTKVQWKFGVKKLVEVIGQNCFKTAEDTKSGKAGWTFRISYEDTESGGLYAGKNISEFALVKKGTIAATPSQASQNWIEVETGDEGTIELESMLPGTYRVLELEKEGEVRYGDFEEKTYILSINRKNQMSLNGQPGHMAEVTNKLRRYRISGKKQAEDTKEGLKGAVIGLFPSDAPQLTEGNLFYSRKAVSDDSGYFYFENIPYGTYKLAELKAPDGYMLNQDIVYRIEVSGEENRTITAGNKGKGKETIVINNTPAPYSGTSGGGGHGSGSRGPVANQTEKTPEPETSLAVTETIPDIREALEVQNIQALSVSHRNAGMLEISVPEGVGVPVELWDKSQRVVYQGRSGADGKIRAELPEDEYTLVVLDEEGVPLAFYRILLTDSGGEGLPKTGDTQRIPLGLIAMLFLGALLPQIVYFRKREEDEEEKAVFRGKQHFVKKQFFLRSK